MKQQGACTLTEAETRERRRTILDTRRRDAPAVTLFPLGYAYRFEPDSEVLAQLPRVIDLERPCCPFLTFGIMIEAATYRRALKSQVPRQPKR